MITTQDAEKDMYEADQVEAADGDESTTHNKLPLA